MDLHLELQETNRLPVDVRDMVWAVSTMEIDDVRCS